MLSWALTNMVSHFPSSIGSAPVDRSEDIVAALCWLTPTSLEFLLVSPKNHEVAFSPFPQSAEMPLSGSTVLSCIGWFPQLGGICRFAKCMLFPLSCHWSGAGQVPGHTHCGTPLVTGLQVESPYRVQHDSLYNMIHLILHRAGNRPSDVLPNLNYPSHIQQRPWYSNLPFLVSFLDLRKNRNHISIGDSGWILSLWKLIQLFTCYIWDALQD